MAWHLSRTMGRTKTPTYRNNRPSMLKDMKKVVLNTPFHTYKDGTVLVTDTDYWVKRQFGKPKNWGQDESPPPFKSALCCEAVWYGAAVIEAGWRGVTDRKRPEHLGVLYADEDRHGFAIGTDNLNNYVSNAFSDLKMKQLESKRRRWDDGDEEGPPHSKAKTFSFDSDGETPSST